ncbi:MAG: hypothetical protein K5776_09605 [Lachnospiraceae bacterium]|nr:hypothetical protein [Lachnospiraceae bacterium]
MGFESERKSIEEMLNEYRDVVADISKYLPWLETKSGEKSVSFVNPEGSENTMAIPVYDSTLLAFVKMLDKTGRMNRNYDYVFKRYRIYSVADELSLIHRADLKDMDMLFAILSKYVIRGRSKGAYWNEAVQNGVFYETVKKMKELIEFWSMPMQ